MFRAEVKRDCIPVSTEHGSRIDASTTTFHRAQTEARRILEANVLQEQRDGTLYQQIEVPVARACYVPSVPAKRDAEGKVVEPEVPAHVRWEQPIGPPS